jgi:dTDP-4-dehydrorhamnose reductase
MNIGITGFSGFLGNAVTVACQQKGYKVIRIILPRTQEIKEVNYLHQLLEPLKLDAIVHTAVCRHPKTDLNEYFNAEFPASFEQCFRHLNNDCIFIHISSINVLMKSLQDRYTKTKRVAEQCLAGSNAIIIRPSLIWSWQGEGDAKRLEKLMSRQFFAPMLYPGNLHLPVLVEDIAEKIVDLLEGKKKIYHIFGDTACSVWELAKCVSRKYKKRLVPIPTLPDVFFLPKILRTINYTQFESNDFQKPDEVIILPFKFDCSL